MPIDVGEQVQTGGLCHFAVKRGEGDENSTVAEVFGLCDQVAARAQNSSDFVVDRPQADRKGTDLALGPLNVFLLAERLAEQLLSRIRKIWRACEDKVHLASSEDVHFRGVPENKLVLALGIHGLVEVAVALPSFSRRAAALC